VNDAHYQPALIWADGGYTGSLVAYCLAALALVLAVVKRSDDQRGFVVLPKRWIVERLFAHLNDPAHDPPPGEVTSCASVNRTGAGSASQSRATRRFAFARSASTHAGTTSMSNAAAIPWQVSGP
jgi:transposase